MAENKGSISILSGPVGSGKTTVAQELVKITRHPVVYIEGDKFWFFISKSTTDRIRNFRTVMSSMTAAAVPFAVAGYEVILDFSMPPWYLETAKKISGKRDILLNYII